MGAPKVTTQQHVLVVGPNGTGKTTLAKKMVSKQKAAFVLDTKRVGDFGDLGWPEIGDPRRIVTSNHAIYAAPIGAEPKELDGFFLASFRRGHCVILIDEAVHVCSASYIAKGFRGVLRSGRGRGVVAVTLAQRVVGLHNDVLSESWTYILFRLDGTDADKLASWGVPGDVLERAAAQRAHEYLVYDREERSVRFERKLDPTGVTAREKTGRRRGKGGKFVRS